MTTIEAWFLIGISEALVVQNDPLKEWSALVWSCLDVLRIENVVQKVSHCLLYCQHPLVHERNLVHHSIRKDALALPL